MDLALALATGPTPAMVVAGLVMGTKGVVVDDPEGAEVIEDPPAVDDGKPEFEEAGEAVCVALAEIERELDEPGGTGAPRAEELTDELSGQ